MAEARAQLREQGVRVLSDEPDEPDEPDTVYDNGEAAGLSRLRASQDTPTTENLTAQAHASCPGHAAKLRIWRSYGASASDVEVDYFCTNPTTYGHVDRYTSSVPSKPKLQALPPEQAEQARQERRRILRLNREWDSAARVRIDWVTQLLQRKSPPKNAPLFIAAALAHGSHPLRKAMDTRHPLACTMLGLPEPQGYYGCNPITELLDNASTARATHVGLAVILGAIEQSLGRHSYRTITADTSHYLTTLRGWGYSLSEVETIAAGETPEEEPGSAAEAVQD
jgi:ParB family chromosome partitioning protein